MKRHKLLDRIVALERRSQGLQQQLEALLGRDTGSTSISEDNARSVKTGKRRARRLRSNGPVADEGRNRDEARIAPAAPTGSPRISGVRIAYIGAHEAAVDRIRDYWQQRGAVFTAHSTLDDTSFTALARLLGPEDVVFACAKSIGEEPVLRLQAYCAYAEKALVPLHNAGLSGLRRALFSWRPMA